MITAAVLALVIEFLAQVESPDNPRVKDNADCVGGLQIRPIVVNECNRLAGYRKWKQGDRRDPVKSRAIALEYLTAKCPRNMTVFGVAMPWKKGSDGTLGEWSLDDEDYCERVQNLFNDARKP